MMRINLQYLSTILQHVGKPTYKGEFQKFAIPLPIPEINRYEQGAEVSNLKMQTIQLEAVEYFDAFGRSHLDWELLI